MRKQIIPYILFATILLSACQAENFETGGVDHSGGDELRLTVGESVSEALDGRFSRAIQEGANTIFEKGELLGLIILDADGNLLADNVPYKYDGENWDFDTENTEGKRRVYYDKDMSTYIVYFPYDSSVDGAKSISYIKSLEAFKRRHDQSTKDAYRRSDLMVWSETGTGMKHLNVMLGHVRSSLSLNLKLKRQLGLPNGETLEYHPLRKAMKDFKVRYEDGTPLLDDETELTYYAEDGTYRYILSEDYDGLITWRYTYRNLSFGGECKVTAGTPGIRYVQDTSAEIDTDKVEDFDFYCSKDIGDAKYGYVLPWDAEECFDGHQFIGVVLSAGHNKEDLSDYSESGIGREKCSGYVMALTDVYEHNDNNKYEWAVRGTEAADSLVTTAVAKSDWSGYKNLITMKKYAEQSLEEPVDKSIFPAAHACETYGTSVVELAAPCNSSGWFLPTIDFLDLIYKSREKLEECLNTIIRYTPDDCVYKNYIHLFNDDNDGYWSSSEFSRDWAYYKTLLKPTSKEYNMKYIPRLVRAALAF